MKLAKKSLYRITKYFWQGVWSVKGMKLAEKSSYGVIKPFTAGNGVIEGHVFSRKEVKLYSGNKCFLVKNGTSEGLH